LSIFSKNNDYRLFETKNTKPTTFFKKESNNVITLFYGTVNEGSNYLCYPKSVSIDKIKNSNSVELSDLQPDTDYYFVIKTDDKLSSEYTFRTAKLGSQNPMAKVHLENLETNTTDLTVSERKDFTVIALPDTQHYTYRESNFQIFIDQTQWIINQKVNLNIVLVDHLGDIVDYSEPVQWNRARQALNLLNQNDIAIGVAPGNHDYNAIDVIGPADLYDKNFPATNAIATADGLGITSYQAYNWYGGYMGGTNDVVTADDGNYENRLWKNNYVLFSAGGMDFINIALEYNFPYQTQQWVDAVLNAFPNRRAIISTHKFLSDDNTLNSSSGNVQAVLDNILQKHCNVFLILSGHYYSGATPGEAERDEINACGKPVYLRMSNYQEDVNGGNGFLRMMTFHPKTNTIDVKTYSPVTNEYKTDADSQFTLAYDMSLTDLGLEIKSPENNQNFPAGTSSIKVKVKTSKEVDYVEVKLNGKTFIDTENSENPEKSFEVTASGSNGWLPTGTYTIEVIAYDNETSSSSSKQITITVDPTLQTLNIRISSANDDAEENVSASNGHVDVGSSDLEFYTEEATDVQQVGLRFKGLTIPKGAIVERAYLEFTADEINSGPVTITIAGEAISNSSVFSASPYNISSRTKTNSKVNWSPENWTVLGAKYKTSDLTNIVQEIVDQSNWVNGNAMSFILYGGATATNSRIAESFEGGKNIAPLLHIEYAICSPTTYYADNDGDGFGNSNQTLLRCNQPVGYVLNNTDCDDTNADINSAQQEIIYNGIDDDCNSATPDSINVNIENSQCGVTILSTETLIFADENDLATAYRFEIINGNSIRFVESYTRSFSLSQISGEIPFGTTYSIRVQIKVYGIWRNFGQTCSVYLVPLTSLIASQCGITLPLVSTPIWARPIVSASDYRFQITKGSEVRLYETSNRYFNLSQLTGFVTYDSAYSIAVSYKLNGEWSSFGPSCIVKTPVTVGQTKLIDSQCGSVLASISTPIWANEVFLATSYRFEVSTAIFSSALETTNRYFLLSQFSGINYNTTYTIRVAVKFNGIWQEYGPSCTVSTPSSVPTTKLIDSLCGGKLSSLTSQILANEVYLATDYRFEVTNDVLVRTYETKLRYFLLSQLQGGGSYNTTYSIRVAVKFNNVWQAYGPACILKTPTNLVARMSQINESNVSELTVKAFPNPFVAHFNLAIESSSDELVEVKIYDMVGRQLEVCKATVTELSTREIGSNYPTGVYNVIVAEGDKVRYIRVIKR
jgi:hypothetical protein